MLKDLQSEKQLYQVPFVESQGFMTCIGLVILLNTLVMGLTLDFQHCDRDMSEAACTEQNAVPNVWWVIESIFISIFIIEIILRLRTYRLSYFKSGANLLDFGLVALGVTDNWILSLTLDDGGSNLKAFQVLRMFRYARLFRVVRLLRFFRELTLLCEGLFEAMKALSWVALLMVIWIYTSSIFLRKLLMTADDFDALNKEYTLQGCYWDANWLWGSIPACMWTLFQVCTLDAWASKIVRPVLVWQPVLIIFFIAFIFVATYGLLNVAIGVLVETTLGAATTANDRIAEVMEAERRQLMCVLIDVFERADIDGDKMLSFDEFEGAWRTDKFVRERLQEVDLDLDEAHELFEMLDDDCTGAVSIPEFFKGVIKLKGNAKGRDMVQLTVAVANLQKQMTKLDERTSSISGRMTEADELADELLKSQLGQFKALRLAVEAIDVCVPPAASDSPTAAILSMAPALHLDPELQLEREAAPVTARRLDENGVHGAAPVKLDGFDFTDRRRKRWSAAMVDETISSKAASSSSFFRFLNNPFHCGHCDVSCNKETVAASKPRKSLLKGTLVGVGFKTTSNGLPPEAPLRMTPRLNEQGSLPAAPHTRGSFIPANSEMWPPVHRTSGNDHSIVCLAKDKDRIEKIRERLTQCSLAEIPEAVVIHYLIAVWETMMSKRGVWRIANEQQRGCLLSEAQHALRTAITVAAYDIDPQEDAIQVQSVTRLLLGAGAGSKGRKQSEYLCQAMAMMDGSSNPGALAGANPYLYS
eukprot:gnl/MRDRNA2_/MRDRNA2_80363_c0_seq3.p1 gnl/MRDRNA2_/MRDRNA2_80363_c0~~gnl/MRDRNA2_/MRDRNA2_80363_c0_seq3.p1  ORF type:complete len:758 (+),score=138.67 gnl/MRDRNA2_/MRDRNA2_80363_c0_seq3:212-2485(+)